MRVHELLNPPPPKILLEGMNLAVFEALLPLLLIEENGDGELPAPPPVDPTLPATQGSYWGSGPFRRSGIGMNANHWFTELHRTLKNMAIASNISKRLKELGVKNAGAKRVKGAVKTASQQVKNLLSNPGATAYKIPVWRFGSPPKPVIKKWNESFELAFRAELSKINLNEGD